MSSGTVPRVQCSAMNKFNRRCLHFTNMGMLCWQHAKKDQGVRIAPSKVKDAKLGLFATRKFKEGERIVPFTGVKKHTTRDIGGEYLLKVDRDKYIDAANPNTAAGRYVNESLNGDPGRNNAEFVYSTVHKTAGLKALETIKPGKEIMADYGNHFWSARHKFIKARKIKNRAPAIAAPLPVIRGIVPRRLPAAPAPAPPAPAPPAPPAPAVSAPAAPARPAPAAPLPIIRGIVPRRLPGAPAPASSARRIIPVPVSVPAPSKAAQRASMRGRGCFDWTQFTR